MLDSDHPKVAAHSSGDSICTHAVDDVHLALRTCAVQLPNVSRLAWQIRWWSCALVENKAHRF
jgi:hypothetical protein